MDDKIFTIVNEDGQEIEKEIVVVLHIDSVDKDYVIYCDNGALESGAEDINLEVARIDDDGNIFEVETDEELALVQEAYEGYCDATEE